MPFPIGTTPPLPPSRYTGLVCRNCTEPVAVLMEGDEGEEPLIACPKCGHTAAPPPPIRL